MKRPDIAVVKITSQVILKYVRCINKTSRAVREKHTCRVHKLYKQQNDDDHPPTYTNQISNRRAKFASLILRGKFGSFFVAQKWDKHLSKIRCRSPPISFAFHPTKNETEDVINEGR